MIPARNAEATLRATLEGLARQDVEVPFEVIVVDNGSSDGTADVAEGAPVPTRLVRREPGEGPGAARNEGARVARGQWLAFTDADCVPVPGWLSAGLLAFEKAELIQGAVLPDPEAVLMPFDRTVWVDRETGLYETANLFVARAEFERAGGFEDWVRTDADRPFGEDVWLGWKLRRGGVRAGFSAAALVHHAVFSRGPLGYLAERRRLSLFPRLAARIPELRGVFFYRRIFMRPRSAAFDLAVVAGIVATALSSAMPLLAVAPYAYLVGDEARGWGRWAPAVAVTAVAADAVGLVSLAWGSLRARSLIL